MMKKLFTFLLALAASVGMMNAKVTWNSSNISDLKVRSYQSYSKEGVTLSANSDMVEARWQDFGDESMDGISFNANETGGFTFSNTLGKNFTKIEMLANRGGGWDMANLGSGWSFYWDYSDNPATITWTGNAATVDLVKDASGFNGESVKSIVFYFVGDSEAPDPTYAVALKAGTANADKVTLSATSAVEGATVTVTPNEDYEITAFSAYYVVVEEQLNIRNEVDATLNAETGAYSFKMPAYDVTIEATIALKPVPEGDIFAGFTATAGSGGFDNEGHANLVDGKFTSAEWTKWCTNDGHKSVPTGESESCWWIDFEASAALNPTGYILTTGNDTGNEHGRNPKNWVLKAKLNAEDAWTTIATVTDDATMKNKSFKDYKFFVDQSGSYKYFRFEVFANQGAGVMQLCELRLIGTEPSLVTTHTLQLHVNDALMGSVAVTNLLGSDIIDNGDGTYTVPEGAEVTLLATPNEGYEFSGWKASQTICDFADCEFVALNTVDNPLTFDMYAEAAFLAEFKASAPATKPIVVFEANGNKKEVEIESFPHTFWCSFDDEDGELDLIIQELYGLSMGGFCDDDYAPTATGNAAVTAGKAGTTGEDHYITISDVFAGTATVEGSYYVWYQPLEEESPEAREKEYSLTISIKGATPTGVENVQTNHVQATKFFRDGQLLIEKNGKIYNVMGTVVR